MVIKIKSDGPTKTKEVVCTKCTYLLEYTGEDVVTSTGYSFGEYNPSYWIVCPRCQENVSVRAWRL